MWGTVSQLSAVITLDMVGPLWLRQCHWGRGGPGAAFSTPSPDPCYDPILLARNRVPLFTNGSWELSFQKFHRPDWWKDFFLYLLLTNGESRQMEQDVDECVGVCGWVTSAGSSRIHAAPRRG